MPLKSRNVDEIYSGIDDILRNYNKAGFRIKTIHCDGEFKEFVDPIRDELDIDINYTSMGEHIPEAERNNRTIEERIRATYHSLPYDKLPRNMLKHLAMISAHQLNLLPAKRGISEYYSSHVIMGKKNIDYEKHCQINFGAYIQANQENVPTNTEAPRTIDAIYLRPLNNIQGGHELMNLSTGSIITRNKVREVPATELVIRAVEKMAESQGFRSLKVAGSTNCEQYLLLGHQEWTTTLRTLTTRITNPMKKMKKRTTMKR